MGRGQNTAIATDANARRRGRHTGGASPEQQAAAVAAIRECAGGRTELGAAEYEGWARAHGRLSRTQVTDYFRGWNAAVTAAGLRPRRRGAPSRHKDPAQVLAALRQCAAGRERLGWNEYREWARTHGMPSHSTIERLFGSWNAAVEAAGLVPSSASSRVDEIELVAALSQCIGSAPTLTRGDYERWAAGRDVPSLSTMVRHFGGWDAALAAVDQHARSSRPAA